MPLGRKSSKPSSRTPTRERSLNISGPTLNDGISQQTYIAPSLDHTRRAGTPEGVHQSTSSSRGLGRPISIDWQSPQHSSRLHDSYRPSHSDGETLAKRAAKPLPEVPVSPLHIPPPLHYSGNENFEQEKMVNVDLTDFDLKCIQNPYSPVEKSRQRYTKSLYNWASGVQHEEQEKRSVQDPGIQPVPDMAAQPWRSRAIILILILGCVAGVAIGVAAHVRIASLQDRIDPPTTSGIPTLNASPIEKNIAASVSIRDPSPIIDATIVILVTSFLKKSETPSSTPVPTSTLGSSSIQSSSLSISPSSQSSVFMQSTAVLENIIRRSGYLDQDDDFSPHDSHLDLDQGGYLGRREDPEDCEDTTITITTTLTTTITSTIRTSRMAVSSAGSSSASPQPPEPEPAETIPKCITNTIFHTDGLPVSTDSSYDTDIPSMEFSSVTADPTPSTDTTQPPAETSAIQSLGDETGVISTSSIAQARRLVAPSPWNSLRYLRRFLPLIPGNDEQNRHLLPSLMIMPTDTMERNDADNSYKIQLLSTTSSNAVARRQAQPWTLLSKPNPAVPSRTHESREVPTQTPSLPGLEVKKTYWQVYWEYRQLITQMCYSVKSEVPQTSGDLKMGEKLNKTVCDSFKQDFLEISEGAKCDYKDFFQRLEDKTKALCALDKEGEKYVQSLTLLCHVQDTLRGKVYACGGEEEGAVISGTGKMSTASLMETFDSESSTTREEPAPSPDVETTPDSGQIASSIRSFSLQQNAVEDANPSPVGPSASPVALASEPPLITSAASLLTTSVPPTPLIPGNSPVSTPPTPATDLGVVPPHPSLTPPVYKGPHLARDWPISYPFAIPTGHVAPNIMPADPQVGQLTHFEEGLGACGRPGMISSDFAVATSWEIFDIGREIGGSSLEDGWKSEGVNPDGKLSTWPIDKTSSALCNQGIWAWMADDEDKKLVEQEFVVRDRCAACNVSDLDIQKGIFTNYWGAEAEGRIQVTWEWMQEAPTDVPG